MPHAHCKLAYKLSRVNIKSNDKRVCQNVREAQKVPQSQSQSPLQSPLQLQLQLKAGGRATQHQHQHQDMMWSKIPKYLHTLHPFQVSTYPPQAIISIANVQLIGNGTHSSLHSHSHSHRTRTQCLGSSRLGFSMNGALQWYRHANALAVPLPPPSQWNLSNICAARTPKFNPAAPARRLYGLYMRFPRLWGCIQNPSRMMMGNQLIRL